MTNLLDFHLFELNDSGMSIDQMKYVQCLRQPFAVAASFPCPYSILYLISNLKMFGILVLNLIILNFVRCNFLPRTIKFHRSNFDCFLSF